MSKMKCEKYKRITVMLGVVMAFVFLVTFSSKVMAAETAEDLIISTREELLSFANRVNAGNDYAGKTVRLVNDIAFDGQVGNYTPISGFVGTFDGGGHVISGIVTKPYFDCGLFSFAPGAVIKNVTVKDSEFTCTSGSVGAILGFGYGKISNCHSINNKITSTGNGSEAGGIVGNTWSDIQIINCTNRQGSVQGVYCGGIIGGNSDKKTVIKNCANDATLTGFIVGGLAGYVSEIQNCYNTGNVNSTRSGGSTYGIAAQVKSIISNCYYLSGTASLNYGGSASISKNVKCMEASEMQGQSFLNLLNSNRGDSVDLLPWEYRGTESLYPVPVKVKDLSGFPAAVAAGTYTYTGEAIEPLISVMDGGAVLQADKDYTLTYSDNVDAGTASVKVEGMNLYTGSLVLSFTINKATPQFEYTPVYNKNYGDYTFHLNLKRTVGDSAVITTYASSNSKVASVNGSGYVKIVAPGRAVITVTTPETDNYCAGEANIVINVNPQKVILNTYSYKRHQVQLRWGKSYGASGYEIQYSTNGKFKKGTKKVVIKKGSTISKKLTKLKSRKKYYVRIRSYKSVKVNGKSKKLYSQWTKKSIRVK